MNIDTAASVKSANNDLNALKSNPVGKIKEMIATKDRPLPVTVIAWLGVVGIVMGVLGIVALLAIHPISAIFSAILVLANAVATIGLFGMRKWAVQLIVIATILNVVIMLLSGGLAFVALGIQAVIIAICVKYYPKMT